MPRTVVESRDFFTAYVEKEEEGVLDQGARVRLWEGYAVVRSG